LNSFAHLHGDGTNLGVWHEPTRTENFSEPTYDPHHVGGSNRFIKLKPSFISNALGKFFSPNNISPSGFRLPRFLSLCKDSNSHRLASTVGEHDSPPYILVSFARINSEAEGKLNRLIKLCFFRFTNERNCFFQ
jgi:hypothetical protein